MNVSLRVLIVEDSENDAVLMLRELRRGGYQPFVERVETAQAMSAALEGHNWDIILADYSLPEFNALAALHLVRDRGLDLPFIIVSGRIGEEVAVAAMKAGAHDYVMKDKLARLVPAIERELREAAGRRERRQAEAALKYSEAKNRAILSAIPDTMFCISQDGTFLDFLPADDFQPVVSKSDVLGKNVREILPVEMASAITHYARQALSTGETQIFEYQIPLNNNLRDYEVRIVNTEDVQIETDGSALAIVRDISGRKRAEAALQQLNEQLETKVEERTAALTLVNEQLRYEIAERQRLEAEIRLALAKEKELNLLKSRFVYMVTHEFRNPLTVILGFTGLLENHSKKLSKQQQKKYFSRIKEAVRRMTDLLEDVLIVGRSDVDKLAFNPTPLNLENFCCHLVEEVQMGSVNNTTISFIWQGSGTDACMDEKLLRHILSNLLSNALKYSPPDSKVYFKLAEWDGEAIFHIQDQGIGITPEDQERLFEPFYRGQNASEIPGTGLGLAIVKRATDLHRGTILVTSEPGSGTTFTVKLPLNAKKCENLLK